MANVIVSAIATFNGKGLTKGQKQIKSFEKSVKSLGRTLGISLGAAALVAFGKKAVQAFSADEKAAKSLETQLKNVGLGFADPAVETYIANLQNMTGVLDDHLRPAFQSLLTATGTVTESQKALQVALDTSAATGMSLEEVSSVLAAGYNGQTKGLKSLGVHLSATALKAGNMSMVLKEIGTAYSGQALARLDTYAGKYDLLNVAVSNATESIGKGLLDAMMAIGKDTSIDQTKVKIESLGTTIGNLITGFGVLLGKLNSLDKATGVSKFLQALDEKGPVGILARMGAKASAKNQPAAANVGGYGGIPSIMDRVKIKEINLTKKSNAARALELAALNKKTAVDQLKDKFDLERIGLTAALNAATDDETKLRLKSQLAILDNNEALAKKYLAELEAADAAKKMAESMKQSAEALEAAFKATIARLAIYDPVRNIAPGQGGGISNAPSGGISTNVVNGNNSLFNQPSNNQGSNYTNVTLELAPNAGEFGQLIYNSFLINQRNGLAQNYAGGL